MKIVVVSEKMDEKAIVRLPHIEVLTHKVAKAVVALCGISVPALVAGGGKYTRIMKV